MGGLAKWRFGGFAAVARSSDLFDAVTHGSDGTQTQLEAQRLQRWRRDEDSSPILLKAAMLKVCKCDSYQDRHQSCSHVKTAIRPPLRQNTLPAAVKFSKRVFSAEPRPKIAPFVLLTREGSKKGASANSS